MWRNEPPGSSLLRHPGLFTHPGDEHELVWRRDAAPEIVAACEKVQGQQALWAEEQGDRDLYTAVWGIDYPSPYRRGSSDEARAKTETLQAYRELLAYMSTRDFQ